jgi:hypothetical protein
MGAAIPATRQSTPGRQQKEIPPGTASASGKSSGDVDDGRIM